MSNSCFGDSNMPAIFGRRITNGFFSWRRSSDIGATTQKLRREIGYVLGEKAGCSKSFDEMLASRSSTHVPYSTYTDPKNDRPAVGECTFQVLTALRSDLSSVVGMDERSRKAAEEMSYEDLIHRISEPVVAEKKPKKKKRRRPGSMAAF